MTTYTTTRVKFEELTKKVNRIFKKLDKVGATHKFEEIRSFVKQVPVYANDEINKVTYYTHEDMNVECVEYVLEFDPYVVAGYRFGAVIERATDENLVYVADDAVNFKDYVKCDLVCEHCGTNHKRNKCVVLINNETGEHKMVGTSCVKDFIGYNVEQFAKYFTEIEQILLQDEEIKIYDFERNLYTTAIDNVEYLARCIKITEKDGYTKELKFFAERELGKTIEDKYIEKAKEVINFFETYEPWDGFESDTRIFVTGRKPITNANGFVAYAYTLYNKIIAKLNKKKEEEAHKALSNFVGEVGKKITATGKIIIAGGYETMYGYTRIYKLTDENNNVYIWKTGNCLNITNENGIVKDITEIGTVEMTGTIKEHNEYNGEKQTVLTRCKVRELVAV